MASSAFPCGEKLRPNVLCKYQQVKVVVSRFLTYVISSTYLVVSSSTYLLTYLLRDQVIRENPASRGTETSAEVLVGPPGRMESNAGPQQWY